MNKINVKINNLEFNSPIIPASGCFGFGMEFSELYDLNVLGGISVKGATLEERFGNPLPRVAECASGMLNSIGLQNPGAERIVSNELPQLRKVYDGNIIANINGNTIEEYIACAKIFDASNDVDALEINVSCPNVKNGGIAFGMDKDIVFELVTKLKAEVTKPIYIKLSPNASNIIEIAQQCEKAGADAIVVCNTFVGMAIDYKTGKPILGNTIGGFSGPAIKPLILKIIYSIYPHVNIPIIGVGGISCAKDIVEFFQVGASAVEIGTMNLIDPYFCDTVTRDLNDLLDEMSVKHINDLKGITHEQ